MLNHKFKIEIGDWSGDGHAQSEIFVIECNYSLEEVEKAYENSVKLVGIDIIEEVAEDYEDNTLTRIQIDKLSKYLNLEYIVGTCDPKYNTYKNIKNLNTDSYLNLVIEFIKLSLPFLEYNIINDGLSIFHIGGYGLFS